MTVYFAQRRSDNAVKVGYTYQIGMRVSGLRTEYGAIDILGTMDGDEDDELAIQIRFAEHCLGQGKMRGTRPPSDWFAPIPELMTYIKENTKPYRDVTEVTARIVLPIETYNLLRLVAGENKTTIADMLTEVAMMYASTLQAQTPSATASREQEHESEAAA